MNRGARRLVLGLLVLYWLGILTATHLPPSRLPQTHVSDKLEHFVAYTILGVLLCVSLPLICPQWSLARIALCAIPILLIYAALDELTQPWFGRTCSLYDWYADAAGSFCAVFVAGIWAYFTAAAHRS